jgi:hypothetical protein
MKLGLSSPVFDSLTCQEMLRAAVDMMIREPLKEPPAAPRWT